MDGSHADLNQCEWSSILRHSVVQQMGWAQCLGPFDDKQGGTTGVTIRLSSLFREERDEGFFIALLPQAYQEDS